jgi:hypothetical protein
VPGVNIAEAKDEVHAFRVDATDRLHSIEFEQAPTYFIREVPVTSTGTVRGQTQLAVDYGMIWNCIALIFTKDTCHSVKLRLYRPGYELVEIDSWWAKSSVDWKPVTDSNGQEKALDDLMAAPSLVSKYKHFLGIPSGSASDEHRRVLVFAAAEYERLAAQLPDHGEVSERARTRLLDKADELKALAAK